MNNFICPNCQKTFSIPQYNYNGTEYKDKISKKPLTCDVDGAVLEYIEKKFTGVPNYGKIASMSTENRSKVLKKRASTHYKKEIKEVEVDMQKQMIKGLMK